MPQPTLEAGEIPTISCVSPKHWNHFYSDDTHDDSCLFPLPDVQITIDKGVVDDNTKLSAADYREMLYRDINNRRKEARRAEQARQSSGRATAPVNDKTAETF